MGGNRDKSDKSGGLSGLEGLRKEIDETDEEIMRLIKKRFEAADKIAECKKKAGMPVLDMQREQEVLERIKAIAGREGVDEEAAARIFREIITQTRNRQIRKTGNSRKQENKAVK